VNGIEALRTSCKVSNSRRQNMSTSGSAFSGWRLKASRVESGA